MDTENEIAVIGNALRLEACELLYAFETFDPADWPIVKHTPKWTVGSDRIVGGGPDEPHHGQVFFRTPVRGDVVMAFNARIIPPSYHDLVWFWNTRFDAEPWSAGYLGCLGGWYADMAGIEKLPDYRPSAIAPSFPTEPGRTYSIVSGSIGVEHFIAVDGKLVAYMTDPDVPDPSKPGYFGFGVFESYAEYSHLRVYRPRPTPRPLAYAPASALRETPQGETQHAAYGHDNLALVGEPGGIKSSKWQSGDGK